MTALDGWTDGMDLVDEGVDGCDEVAVVAVDDATIPDPLDRVTDMATPWPTEGGRVEREG